MKSTSFYLKNITKEFVLTSFARVNNTGVNLLNIFMNLRVNQIYKHIYSMKIGTATLRCFLYIQYIIRSAPEGAASVDHFASDQFDVGKFTQFIPILSIKSKAMS